MKDAKKEKEIMGESQQKNDFFLCELKLCTRFQKTKFHMYFFFNVLQCDNEGCGERGRAGGEVRSESDFVHA